MQENFSASLAFVLAIEGGFVNHPKDPGGATNMGVTQAVFSAHLSRKGMADRSVRHIAEAEVAEIYRVQYWDRVRGDDLPAGVDYAVFDLAVNSGVSRAAKMLQAVVGVAQDGVIGEMTLDAVKAMPAADVVRELCRDRMAFLKRLKHWPTFGRGWTRRVEGDQIGIQTGDIGVIDRATRMARGVQNVPSPIYRADNAGAKAPPSATSIPATIKEIAADGVVGSLLSGGAGSAILAAVSSGPLAWAAAFAVVALTGFLIFRLVRQEMRS